MHPSSCGHRLRRQRALGVLFGVALLATASCGGVQQRGNGVACHGRLVSSPASVMELRHIWSLYSARVPHCHALISMGELGGVPGVKLLVAWPEGAPFTSEQFEVLVRSLRSDLMRRVRLPQTRFYHEFAVGHADFHVRIPFSLVLDPPGGHDGFGGENAAPEDPEHVRVVVYPSVALVHAEGLRRVRSPYIPMTAEEQRTVHGWTNTNEDFFERRLHAWTVEVGRDAVHITWETDAGPVRMALNSGPPVVEAEFPLDTGGSRRLNQAYRPAYRIVHMYDSVSRTSMTSLEPVAADHRPAPWEYIVWADPRLVELCHHVIEATDGADGAQVEQWLRCTNAARRQGLGLGTPSIGRVGQYGLPEFHISAVDHFCIGWPYCDRNEHGQPTFGLSSHRLVPIPGCPP